MIDVKTIYNLIELDNAYDPPVKENNYIETSITKDHLESLIEKFNEDMIGFSFRDFKKYLVEKKIPFKVIDVVDVTLKEYDSS